MRRRRLIGMYRVLLKSMNWCAPDDQGLRPAAELPRRPGTPGNRTRTEPDGRLSDWSMQHNRSVSAGGSFSVLSSPFVAVVSGMHSSYLGANGASRNELTRPLGKGREPKGHDHIRQARRSVREKVRHRRRAEI